jgi:uncharacterized protein YuzE
MTRDLQVNVEYDKEYDVLYILVGDPAAAEAEALAEGVYVRRDMFSDRIAGVVIEQYSKKDMKCLSEILPLGLGNALPLIKPRLPVDQMKDKSFNGFPVH